MQNFLDSETGTLLWNLMVALYWVINGPLALYALYFRFKHVGGKVGFLREIEFEFVTAASLISLVLFFLVLHKKTKYDWTLVESLNETLVSFIPPKKKKDL